MSEFAVMGEPVQLPATRRSLTEAIRWRAGTAEVTGADRRHRSFTPARRDESPVGVGQPGSEHLAAAPDACGPVEVASSGRRHGR